MRVWLQRGLSFLLSEDGPTATEYAILLGLLATAALVAMAEFGDHMDNLYVSISGAIPD